MQRGRVRVSLVLHRIQEFSILHGPRLLIVKQEVVGHYISTVVLPVLPCLLMIGVWVTVRGRVGARARKIAVVDDDVT